MFVCHVSLQVQSFIRMPSHPFDPERSPKKPVQRFIFRKIRPVQDHYTSEKSLHSLVFRKLVQKSIKVRNNCKLQFSFRCAWLMVICRENRRTEFYIQK